jgi:cation-transporting P-type ATPase C
MNGRKIQVGSLSFLQEQAIQTKDFILKEQFSVYVAIDGRLAGAFLVQDIVRPGMKNTIKRLRLQGVKKVVMLTGDMHDTANLIAQQVQVDEVYARMLPEEKLRYIEKAKKSGKVVMVGDGMNDAPALTKADIGITFGGKRTDLAVEASDIVVSHDNPYVLNEMIDLSKETMKTVKQNVLATFVINGSAILFGAFGLISTVTGAAIHNLATIGVVLNSIKILVKGEKHRAAVYDSPRHTWKTADSNTHAA